MERVDSIYAENRRSDRWLKVVNYESTGVFTTGIFVLGRTISGIMEFMPNDAQRRLHVERIYVKEGGKFVYIEPIGCRVKHRFKTKNGLLRVPLFHEWR